MVFTRDNQEKHAFTLIEMLVAITVIGVLALLCLQAGRKVFEKHKEVTCLSQLSKIYTALRLYSLDNNNYYPRSYFTTPSWGNWFTDTPLSQYAGEKSSWEKIVICPTGRTAGVVPATTLKGFPYTVNYNILRATAPSGGPEYGQINAATLPYASQLVLMLDAKPISGQWGIGFNSMSSGWGRANANHQKHANVLWADGHVTSTQLADLTDEHIVPGSPKSSN